jgi:hypothetical protein
VIEKFSFPHDNAQNWLNQHQQDGHDGLLCSYLLFLPRGTKIQEAWRGCYPIFMENLGFKKLPSGGAFFLKKMASCYSMGKWSVVQYGELFFSFVIEKLLGGWVVCLCW